MGSSFCEAVPGVEFTFLDIPVSTGKQKLNLSEMTVRLAF